MSIENAYDFIDVSMSSDMVFKANGILDLMHIDPSQKKNVMFGQHAARDLDL